MARFDVYIVTRQIKFAIISERNAVRSNISRVENYIDRPEEIVKENLNFNRATRILDELSTRRIVTFTTV